MWPDLRAETLVQLRRPANWLLLIVALGLTVTFAYLIPYAGIDGDAQGGAALGRLLPAAFSDTAIGGLPAFTGALALIFGVLVVGSDYSFETWKALLLQQPSRPAVFACKVGVLVLGSALLVVAVFVVSAGASLAVAGVESSAATLPPLREIAADAGAAWLIAFMWAMLGTALAVSLRGVALPVGIGLVWMLAVQNLITLAAPLLDWVDVAQQWLPGPAAGSLVAGLGAREDTPGVAELSGQTQSVFVLVAYTAAFAGLAVALLKTRDVT